MKKKYSASIIVTLCIATTMFIWSCKKESVTKVGEPNKEGRTIQQLQGYLYEPSDETRSGGCAFNTQGIHSLSDYDTLVAHNVFPLSELSSTAKSDFRSGLFFSNAGSRSQTVVIGFKRGLAYSSLTYSKYVDLIQLVAGINPTGDTFEDYYDVDENLPSIDCTRNYQPNPPSYSPPCLKNVWDQECCTPRMYIVTESCS